MSQDVTQWLAEIKTLQQQLATARQERDEAYNSSTNWRKLYETEAQQRRNEVYQAQQTIETLKLELAKLKGNSSSSANLAAPTTEFQSQVEQLQTPEALRIRLLEVLQEREQLAQSLKAEQSNHAQTRKSLTTALGDAVDRLTKERIITSSQAAQEDEATKN